MLPLLKCLFLFFLIFFSDCPIPSYKNYNDCQLVRNLFAYIYIRSNFFTQTEVIAIVVPSMVYEVILDRGEHELAVDIPIFYKNKIQEEDAGGKVTEYSKFVESDWRFIEKVVLVSLDNNQQIDGARFVSYKPVFTVQGSAEKIYFGFGVDILSIMMSDRPGYKIVVQPTGAEKKMEPITLLEWIGGGQSKESPVINDRCASIS